MRTPSGLRIDSPSWPLLQAHISYWGITSLAGNALGTTLVCADLVNEPSYQGLSVKVLDGGAAGQVQQIVTDVAGTITVVAAFTNAAGAVQQIAAGTRFVILSIAGGAGAPAPVLAPSIGLWMFGECDPGMGASLNTLVLTNLAHFPDDIFNNEFWVQVIHNADVPGAAPEREIRRVTDYVGATGTFTCDDFSANVEANDLVCVFHESIMGIEILGYGTLTLSSATVPEDNLRLEVDNYFNGCLFMATEGACRFQPRRIVDWAVGGAGPGSGIFTLDPNNPLTGLPGIVDYVIIGDQTEFIPPVDGVNDRTPSDVIGGKADTPIYSAAFNVSSIIRYLKGLMSATITAWGTADAGSGAGLIRDAARAEVDDWWNGQTVLMLTGAAAFQKRPITDFLAASDDIIVAPNFDAAVGVGDIYVILAHYNMIVPRAADDVANALTSQVIGRKDDTALHAAAANATLMRYIKGLITAGIAVPGAVSDVGPAITDFNTDLAEATDDHYNGMLLMFIDGPNVGQAHTIHDYTGGTKNVAFKAGDRWTDVPVDGNNFVILPSAALYLLADVAAIEAKLDDGTTGLANIKALIDAIETKLDTPATFMADVSALALEATLGTHDTDIKALLATIAGYIDAEVAAIITSQGRQLFTMDFWSDPQEEVQVPAAAATLVLTPTVQVAERPAGATIVRVTAMFKFRMVENTYDGANALDGATVAANSQVIQVKETAAGAYVDAINFADNQFTLDNLTREGGDVLIGSIDIAGEVNDNDNYTFQWLLRKCDSDFINFNDVQLGLRIWYSV